MRKQGLGRDLQALDDTRLDPFVIHPLLVVVRGEKGHHSVWYLEHVQKRNPCISLEISYVSQSYLKTACYSLNKKKKKGGEEGGEMALTTLHTLTNTRPSSANS